MDYQIVTTFPENCWRIAKSLSLYDLLSLASPVLICLHKDLSPLSGSVKCEMQEKTKQRKNKCTAKGQSEEAPMTEVQFAYPNRDIHRGLILSQIWILDHYKMIKDAQKDLYSLQKYNKYCIAIFLIKRNFSRREIW